MLKVIQKDWPWKAPLQSRATTKYCVWHHTACTDQNQDTQAIENEHLAVGDIGIAYNRIIKGTGDTVQGRPDWAVSAAAHGANYDSIDIVVEGNFEYPQSNEIPTPQQLQAIKDNMEDVNIKYPGIIHVGHDYVTQITGDPGDATACPGNTLIKVLHQIMRGFLG